MKISDIAWVRDSDLTTPAKLILMCLVSRANKRRQCFPSQRTISRDSGLCERSVREHLKILEEGDKISRVSRARQNGTRTSDVYTIHAPRTLKRAIVETVLTVVGGTGS